MRIVAGRFKGIRLQAPDGAATRPTGDRAREGLFNILAHGSYAEKLRGGQVLELFAGTGALGLEALSRGAAFCTFVERDRRALALLRDNIAKCKAEQDTRVVAGDGFAPSLSAPVDLVLLDPPYDEGAVERALAALITGKALSGDTLIVTQSDPKTPVDVPEALTVLDDRKYGAARFLFLERADD